MATQDEVRAVHRLHPRWTAPEIVRELDCTTGYVRATARRLRIHLPKAHGVQALGEAAKAVGMTLADIEAWARRQELTEPQSSRPAATVAD